MPKPLWSGSLSFGLINIPVRMYGAAVDRELQFNMLHEKDLSPIRFVRVCSAEGKPVPFPDIVKGYEFRKGDYVILHDEDFEKANVHKTKTIDVIEFSDAQEVEMKYFEKPYYLEPDPNAAKAYILLREALKKSGKVGIAKFVLRNKEHLGLLKPEGNLLMIDQLRFKDELKKPHLNIPERSATGREVVMAIKLIDQLSAHFHPEKFHDAYSQDLKKIINKKAHGKPIHLKGKEPVPTKVPDIMTMLRASLEKEHRKSHK